jgi:hypothetical protein
LICNVSPHPANANESLSTLRFGDRAAKVRNEAKMNVALDPRELKRQLTLAKEELAKLRHDYQRLSSEHDICLQQLRHTTAPGYSTSRPPTACVSSSAAVDDEDTAVTAAADAHSAEDNEATELEATPATAPAAITSQQTMDLIARRLFALELLPSLVCPITRQVMRDPVCAADGNTYERCAIEKLMRVAGRLPAMSPVTGRPLPSKQIVSNSVLKRLVERQLPDLPPLKARLSEFSTLSCYLLEHVCGLLDGRSLGRAQLACVDFLAVGSNANLWVSIVQAELRTGAASKDARDEYVRHMRERARASLKPESVSKRSMGLRLLPRGK